MITNSVQGNAALSGTPWPSAGGVENKHAAVTGSANGPRTGASDIPEQKEANFDLKSVQDAARKIEKFAAKAGSELSFSVDQGTGINVVKVVDTGTKEVIRQIPSREIIQLAEALDKAQGLLVRDKA